MTTTGRARGSADVTLGRRSMALTVLTIFVVLLIAIPSRLIFAPLGGAGTPAEIVGLGSAVLWVLVRISSGGGRRSLNPVRVAMLVFVGAGLCSYIVAATRPIGAAELRAADMGMLSLISWLGVLYISSDLLQGRSELDRLLRVLCIAGGALALLGILQFLTGQPFTNYLQIPGLSINNDLASVLDRGGHSRPAGTAVHPIEFGAVLTTILPIAIHYAMNDEHRNLVVRWLPVAAIAIAVPLSISRSAVVSSIVVLLFLLPTWKAATRFRAYASLLVLFASIYLLVPGLLGTLTGLFTGISGDNSAKSRTDSYSIAVDFIQRAPIFGRGFPTFLSSYRILDNQYLGLLIEMGAVGLLALLALFTTGIVVAIRIRRRHTDAATRSLSQSLAASVAASACSFALFDAFSFPMAASLIFLVLGAIGFLYNCERSEPDRERSRVPPMGRRARTYSQRLRGA